MEAKRLEPDRVGRGRESMTMYTLDQCKIARETPEHPALGSVGRGPRDLVRASESPKGSVRCGSRVTHPSEPGCRACYQQNAMRRVPKTLHVTRKAVSEQASRPQTCAHYGLNYGCGFDGGARGTGLVSSIHLLGRFSTRTSLRPPFSAAFARPSVSA